MSDEDEDNKVKDLLKRMAKETPEYPEKLQKARKDKLLRWAWARSAPGMFFVFLVVCSVVFLLGRIFGWW